MKIFRNTVSDTLWSVLTQLMKISALDSFRLVGGTSLSLQLGHRVSVDIDLFTDSEYGSINFLDILETLKNTFDFVDALKWSNDSMGNSCMIGNHASDVVKLDLYYTDPFAYPILTHEGIRLASLKEISTMKLDVIGRGGRKKDFWDVHKLLEKFSIEDMIEFYLSKYPYNHSDMELRAHLINFEAADHDFDPICLEQKYWQLIKLDFEDLLKPLS